MDNFGSIKDYEKLHTDTYQTASTKTVAITLTTSDISRITAHLEKGIGEIDDILMEIADQANSGKQQREPYSKAGRSMAFSLYIASKIESIQFTLNGSMGRTGAGRHVSGKEGDNQHLFKK